MKKVEITAKQRVFDGKYKIDEVVYNQQRYDGQMNTGVRRLNFERGDSVAALIYHTGRQQYILIEQFRYSTYSKGPGWLLEIVAGTLEAGEDPVAGMEREILEEAGYRATGLERIGLFYVSPGGSSERVHLFYAEVNDANHETAGGGLDEEYEDIQVLSFTKAELLQMLANGQVQDAKTMIAIQWIQLHK